jgi:hypothetical protein
MKFRILTLMIAAVTLAALHAGAANAQTGLPSGKENTIVMVQNAGTSNKATCCVGIRQVIVEVGAIPSRQGAITGPRSVPVATHGHGQTLPYPPRTRVAVPSRR